MPRANYTCQRKWWALKNVCIHIDIDINIDTIIDSITIWDIPKQSGNTKQPETGKWGKTEIVIRKTRKTRKTQKTQKTSTSQTQNPHFLNSLSPLSLLACGNSQRGVRKFKNTSLRWKQILEMGLAEGALHTRRTYVDIKDKWRNLMKKGFSDDWGEDRWRVWHASTRH